MAAPSIMRMERDVLAAREAARRRAPAAARARRNAGPGVSAFAPPSPSRFAHLRGKPANASAPNGLLLSGSYGSWMDSSRSARRPSIPIRSNTTRITAHASARVGNRENPHRGGSRSVGRSTQLDQADG